MFLVTFVGRAVRRFLALVLFTLIRGRRLVLAAVAVLVFGWLLIANIGRLPIPAGTLPAFLQPQGAASTANTGTGGAREPRTQRLAPVNAEAVPSVDSYIKGLTQFDARLMWGALSDEAISTMKQRGGSLEVLQTGLDDAKRRGARYEDVTMIGNYPLQNGGRYLFYVLSRRGFVSSDQLEQVYFVFTVNRDGKITRIE